MESLFAGVLKIVLLEVAALFPIVNPVGTAPIFLSLTRGASVDTRTTLARRIAVNGFILLVASMLIGSYILAFFGISLPVVQVAGGLVVIATGWTLLQDKDEDHVREDAERTASHEDLSRRAFYPLTLPLTVGPGSISVAITLGANWGEASVPHWPAAVAAVRGAVLLAVTIYLSYRFADSIARFLGETAMSVILRLSSFFLVCIGVQIVWNGVSALLQTLRK